MSSILKKANAETQVYKHSPKSFQIATSEVAKEFVSLQQTPKNKSSDFQIADVIAQQSGVGALKKKNIEIQVEETVLDRLKEIEENAYKQAYQLGLIEGSEKAFVDQKEIIAEKLVQFDQALVSLDKMKAEVFKQNEVQIVKLIYQIASRIAMRDIKINQEPIVEMLSQLIAEVENADHINVRLNPVDFQFIEELRAKKIKELDHLERVKIINSPEITSGGCFIETNFGEIDATVEQRVERAWVALDAKLPTLDTNTGSGKS